MVRLPQFSPNIYQVGLGVGLVSISAFFVGLVLAYAFRMESQPQWRDFHIPVFLWLSTTVLALSSGVLERAKYSLRRAGVSKYRTRLGICAGLGVAFMALQVFAGVDLIDQGVTTEANPHGSAFYVFMGIHGVHLLGGIGWLVYLYFRSWALFRGTENDLRKHRLVLSVAATYWHFMGIIWAVLFYLLLRWTAH